MEDHKKLFITNLKEIRVKELKTNLVKQKLLEDNNNVEEWGT